MKKIIYTLSFCLAAFSMTAQKIGHINTQEILIDLPAYKQAETDLQSYAEELKKEFEYFAKLYQEKEAKYLEKEKQCQQQGDACDKELLGMEYQMVSESAQKLEEQQYDMQTKLQEREAFLINKVVEKVKTAAAEVAKEKGIIYVLDQTSIIYAGGEDLNAAVKAKLLEE